MFAVSGVMQAMLLLMCIAWKFRQRRLRIDDFGHPLPPSSAELGESASRTRSVSQDEEDEEARPQLTDEEIVRAMLGERTPLLQGQKKKFGSGFLRVFRR